MRAGRFKGGGGSDGIGRFLLAVVVGEGGQDDKEDEDDGDNGEAECEDGPALRGSEAFLRSHLDAIVHMARVGRIERSCFSSPRHDGLELRFRSVRLTTGRRAVINVAIGVKGLK